ncbi:MAG: DNA photolyase FAD-binding protein [Wenzhouxiangella sp.]|nr:DNA photolyase FAD-binding protein [Wenzhouxiangella sp.]
MFAPHAGREYARCRNSDFGPNRRENVSALSPWVRYRILTERDVVAQALSLHSATAAEKFIQEVFWRTYWKGWLEMRPVVWQDFLSERDQVRNRLQMDAEQTALFQRAEQGRTGIEGFDDWARELVNTGYLHNHARMWFASIWIFTLKLPWSLGAEFFLRHLLDAVPASNTLSWRWVAGHQPRAKLYLARPDNIAKYTDGRFQPRGLAEQAEPLDGPEPPSAQAIPQAISQHKSDFNGQALLLTPEDLHPESLIEGRGRPAQVLVAGPDAFAPDWPWGEKARAFLDGAVDDTVARVSAMEVPVKRIDSLDVAALRDQARTHELQQILTPYTPVGPVADRLAMLQQALTADGIALERVRRDWDEQAWPHARRGFFAFRKHIPDLLKQAGLSQ